jgi:hypothetical protein
VLVVYGADWLNVLAKFNSTFVTLKVTLLLVKLASFLSAAVTLISIVLFTTNNGEISIVEKLDGPLLVTLTSFSPGV